MKVSKLIKIVLIMSFLISVLADDLEIARRRRRRRRRFRHREGASNQHEGPPPQHDGPLPQHYEPLRQREGAHPRREETLPRREGALPKREGTPRRRRLRHAGKRRMDFVRRRLTKFRGRDGPYEGQVRLVDGRENSEGNVEIYHENRWGNICDDEWDLREGEIVCKELGYPDVQKVTYNSHFGQVRHTYWMDNLFCYGTEKRLNDCRHDGWGKHDCERDEAAGVECRDERKTTPAPSTTMPPPKDAPKLLKKDVIMGTFGGKVQVRLEGGRIKEEGRVEVLLPGASKWGVICGDDWSLLEAMVICRQLGLKYAQSAPSTGYFGGKQADMLLSGVKCTGNEESINSCLHDAVDAVSCPGPIPDSNIAGVTCVNKMADLAPDQHELSRSAHLEDKQLFFLQCAIEENCLASSAYKYMDSGYGWHLESRRLLRFTARIVNQGDDAFMPLLPKSHWQWHQCHMHYHSMEVFAHYDITDANGTKVAEGHKASFCLEDNNCAPGIEPVFKCANFGDQGISPGCTDTYAYNIDCQWIDITDLPAGTYTFRLEINPEFKVAEQTFDNNAAICELMYSSQSAWIGNCYLGRPGPKIISKSEAAIQTTPSSTKVTMTETINAEAILITFDSPTLEMPEATLVTTSLSTTEASDEETNEI